MTKEGLAELYHLLSDIRWSSYAHGITSELDVIIKHISREFENEFPNENIEIRKFNPRNAGRNKRFTREESLLIQQRYQEGNITMKQLAEMYDCSPSTIHAIVGDSRYAAFSKSPYYEFEK